MRAVKDEYYEYDAFGPSGQPEPKEENKAINKFAGIIGYSAAKVAGTAASHAKTIKKYKALFSLFGLSIFITGIVYHIIWAILFWKITAPIALVCILWTLTSKFREKNNNNKPQ